MTTPSQPCLNICVIEPSTAICIGCGRTEREIAAWPLLSEDERVAIVGRLAERLTRLTARSPAASDVDGIPARRRRRRSPS